MDMERKGMGRERQGAGWGDGDGEGGWIGKKGRVGRILFGAPS
jgi:hypothetical protein